MRRYERLDKATPNPALTPSPTPTPTSALTLTRYEQLEKAAERQAKEELRSNEAAARELAYRERCEGSP